MDEREVRVLRLLVRGLVGDEVATRRWPCGPCRRAASAGPSRGTRACRRRPARGRGRRGGPTRSRDSKSARPARGSPSTGKAQNAPDCVRRGRSRGRSPRGARRRNMDPCRSTQGMCSRAARWRGTTARAGRGRPARRARGRTGRPRSRPWGGGCRGAGAPRRRWSRCPRAGRCGAGAAGARGRTRGGGGSSAPPA